MPSLQGFQAFCDPQVRSTVDKETDCLPTLLFSASIAKKIKAYEKHPLSYLSTREPKRVKQEEMRADEGNRPIFRYHSAARAQGLMRSTG